MEDEQFWLNKQCIDFGILALHVNKQSNRGDDGARWSQTKETVVDSWMLQPQNAGFSVYTTTHNIFTLVRVFKKLSFYWPKTLFVCEQKAQTDTYVGVDWAW